MRSKGRRVNSVGWGGIRYLPLRVSAQSLRVAELDTANLLSYLAEAHIEQKNPKIVTYSVPET